MRTRLVAVLSIIASFLASSGSVAAQKLLSEGIADLAGQVTANVSRQQQRKVAVIPFRELDGRATFLGTYLSEALVTELFKQGGLEIVERAMLDRIMAELKLGQSGLVDPSTARQVGQVAGVGAIVTGTIAELQSYVAINCRLIDVESGRVFAAAETKIVKDDDVRRIMGVELSQPDFSDHSPGPAEENPSVEWSDRSLRVRAVSAARSARETRVTFLMTNLTTDPFRVDFSVGDFNARNWNTYLQDDSGTRFLAVGGSVFRPGSEVGYIDLVPNLPVSVQLIFDAIPPNARAVTVVLANSYLSPGTFAHKTIQLGPIPLNHR